MSDTEHIVVIGAGFAGLGMGIRLKQAGISDFTILEASAGLGGTWRANTYPNAACDVESHLYSFSFEPNPEWTRQFAPQAEILSYLERTATKWGLHQHLRFNTTVAGASFDERSGHWTLRCSDGTSLRARVIVAACGGLSRPSTPELSGLSRFEGPTFHSARWNHDFSLDGKSVAVIGTGASAIQIVPAIAPRVRQLYVLQRTPPWILPKLDRDIGADERRGFARRPFRQRLARIRQYWWHELLALGFVVNPKILAFASRMARRHLAETIADPALREKLTPSYTMGCKRILISNDYYPALTRPNVELVTSPLREIIPTGFATADGRERSVDAIILATGFEAAEITAPFDVRGRDGRDLTEAWHDGPEAYLGTTVAGFPNMFLLVGPNTGLGHSSMIFMIESQIEYVLDSIRLLRKRRLKFVDVRPEVQRRYNEEIQSRHGKTVWSTGGCVSWYRTRAGKNTTLWPGFTFEFRRRTKRFDAASYELVSEADAAPAESATPARSAQVNVPL